MWKYYRDLGRRYIQPVPVFMLLAGSFFTVFCLAKLAEASKENNRNFIDLKVVPDSYHLARTHSYDDELNYHYYIAHQARQNAESVNGLLHSNDELDKAVEGDLKFKSEYALLAYLHKIDYLETEKMSVDHLVGKRQSGLVSTKSETGFYFDFYYHYLYPLYIASIRQEWELGNFYRAARLAGLLKERYAGFRFDSFDRLPYAILRDNNEIFLILLTTQYPTAMARHRELAEIIGNLVFGTIDRQNISALVLYNEPSALTPIKDYLIALYRLQTKDYSQAYEMFSRLRAQCDAQHELASYAYFMECRCLFWLYDTSLDKQYLELLASHAADPLAEKLPFNLKIDLQAYLSIARSKTVV